MSLTSSYSVKLVTLHSHNRVSILLTTVKQTLILGEKHKIVLTLSIIYHCPTHTTGVLSVGVVHWSIACCSNCNNLWASDTRQHIF